MDEHKSRENTLMKITKTELQELVNNLVSIEIKSVQETLKQSKKDNSPDYFKQYEVMAKSYLKGLERSIEIISTAISNIQDE